LWAEAKILSFSISSIYFQESKTETGKTESKDADKDKDDRKWDPIEIFVKSMLKHPQSNAMDYQERFLRECIREFPHRDSTLFRHMVR